MALAVSKKSGATGNSIPFASAWEKSLAANACPGRSHAIGMEPNRGQVFCCSALDGFGSSMTLAFTPTDRAPR